MSESSEDDVSFEGFRVKEELSALDKKEEEPKPAPAKRPIGYPRKHKPQEDTTSKSEKKNSEDEKSGGGTKNASRTEEEDEDETSEDETAEQDRMEEILKKEEEEVPKVVKRPRGRPRKHKSRPALATPKRKRKNISPYADDDDDDDYTEEHQKNLRKKRQTDAHTPTSDEDYHSLSSKIEEEQAIPNPIKRSRGRPRKSKNTPLNQEALLTTIKRKIKNSLYIQDFDSKEDDLEERKKPGRKKGQSLESGEWRRKKGRDD